MLYRAERAGSFIQEELTELLNTEVRDPRVSGLTITEVEVSRDRRLARVYVACYTGEEALQEGLAGLESAKGYLRRALARSLPWRFAPDLEFRVDRSWEYGNKIEALLDTIHEQETDPPEELEGQDPNEATDE